MSVDIGRKEKSHRKTLRYTLLSIATIAVAVIGSLALYLVVPDYIFPFEALPIFAVLIFLLTLFIENAYSDWKKMDQEVSTEALAEKADG